jgi:multidrug transporter EmrE-like cation transporter
MNALPVRAETRLETTYEIARSADSRLSSRVNAFVSKRTLAKFHHSQDRPDGSLFSILHHREVWGGLIVYGLSAVCWLWVLSRAQLSFAYPILSLTFPIVVGLSAVLFSEFISPMRWTGVGLIVVGVSFLSRT